MRSSRWPIRVRLTALYSTAFLAAGVALVGVTYWLVSRSLTQHRDSVHPHPGYDAGWVDSVRFAIDSYRSDILNDLLTWSIFALVGALVVAVALGWVLAGRALRPLHRVTETANRIADRSLHERIALSGPADEIKELADTIDEMLERLDRSFDAQRRFVANASHELRTPLAVNRTLLEVAIGNPAASADLTELAPRLLATVERSQRLVDGLLALARSEQVVVERSAIDLADVASTTIDQDRPEASERRITVRTDLHPAPVTGSPLLIEQLVRNLVQNAVRHSPTDGVTVVRTGRRDDCSFLEIENPGAVLPADVIDGLFEPFRRGNGRVSSHGVGLGLSIVRSVAQAHGGTVSARPRANGGLIVQVDLPARP